MSTLRFYPSQGNQVVDAFSALFSVPARMMESFMEARRERAAIESLAELDDAMLRDIGLSRADLGGTDISTRALEQLAQSRVMAFALHTEGRSVPKSISETDRQAA